MELYRPAEQQQQQQNNNIINNGITDVVTRRHICDWRQPQSTRARQPNISPPEPQSSSPGGSPLAHEEQSTSPLAHEARSIFISMPNSATVVMEVSAVATVGHVRHALQSMHGIEGLRLIHAGKELGRDNEMLRMPSHDTIRVLFGLQGGGKAKSKGGKSFKKGKKVDTKSELIFKEDGQEYAQVLKLLGSSRLTVLCTDGKERLCTIRGKLVRRAWVSVGSIILVSLRDFEEGKCDMIHKYSDEEARNLRAYNELPHNMKLMADEGDGGGVAAIEDNDDIQFDFDEHGEIDISAI